MQQPLPHAADLRKHRFDAANRIYFVSKRIAVGCNINLAQSELAPIVIQTLFWLMDHQRLWLLGFVIMPDHLHLVLAPRMPHLLRDVMKSLCSYSARLINEQLRRRGPLWAEEYYEHLLANGDEVQPFIEYIHLNPVRKQLVEQAIDWPFSSARPEYHARMSWRWFQGLEGA